jgi:hypothetical protein
MIILSLPVEAYFFIGALLCVVALVREEVELFVWRYHSDRRGRIFWLRLTTDGVGFAIKNTPLIFSERMHLTDKVFNLVFGYRIVFLTKVYTARAHQR